jgi:hypothetical protein
MNKYMYSSGAYLGAWLAFFVICPALKVEITVESISFALLFCGTVSGIIAFVERVSQ